MPTATDGNASQQTTTVPPATPEITDDLLKTIPMDRLAKTHPDVAELQTKHAAARTGLDAASIENKRLKKALTGDDQTTNDQTTQVTTPTDKQNTAVNEDAIVARVRWEMQNSEKIKLAGQPYADLIAKGYDREHALIVALADKGYQVAAITENARQQQTAGAHTTTDRSTTTSPVEGVTQEYIDSLKTGKNPLTDEQIARIVPKVLSEQQRRGKM